jgi:hypothetical protein
MKHSNRFLAFRASAAAILLLASMAPAEQLSGSRPLDRPSTGRLDRSDARPQAFGTSATSVTSIVAWGFNPIVSDVTWEYAAGGYVSRTGGSGTNFYAPVQLPSGALITTIELEGCDDSATGAIELHLWVCAGPGDSCLDQGSYVLGSGGPATPGCDYFARTSASPLTVSNSDHTYFLSIEDPDTSTSTRIRTARVYWRRQISPAPGSASFGDVSAAHPFFQHIEALFGSGITAGCGGGNFCPDRVVTRGEMAVFLAKALGLHWPD